MIKDIIGINRQFYDWTRQGPWTTTSDYLDFNVTREENTLYIKFQESQEPLTINGIHDWIRNINFLFKYDPFIRAFVHRGFLEGWANCAGYIFKEVFGSDLLQGITKIVISANSQGSGIALLCLIYLMIIFEGNPNIEFECYAFTPPQIWWILFSGRIKKYFLKNKKCKVNLIIAYGDPVSKLPLWWWGYKHIGTITMVNDPKAKTDVMHHDPKNFRGYLPEIKEINI